jgi:hypothetical protein
MRGLRKVCPLFLGSRSVQQMRDGRQDMTALCLLALVFIVAGVNHFGGTGANPEPKSDDEFVRDAWWRW